ncbi:outer membrane protein assembly factor BamA [Nisaea acidiphila]|uniref:Outer membrane protein assembly factor BamA n=1 Tax=Nisaea acidiphila TaxID=1862145 RepID=A0A9J7AT65_9PROT|nr:outer membrane protein assembly factor BamA [Nisaea acidiphila]UUX50366.1 outer membrane protein assembly factor BamA [Nisaea acidiphila]
MSARLALARSFFAIAFAAACFLGTPLLPGAVSSAFAQTMQVDEIEVVGTQRVDPETVRSYMSVKVGDVADAAMLDRSLKALFGTGLFADVSIRPEGRRLIVTVVENPVINRIAFEGNKRIKDEDLGREVQLQPRRVFTRTRVQQDVQRILDVYRLSGRFAASVEPKVIQLEQNRVDLVFEIDEGPLTRIRSISFIGNKVFSDSKLRDKIQTKEYAFWRILTTTDTYDPDRLSFDRELLRRFYLSEGYADFKVVNAVAELTPDQKDFVVTFTLEEGEQYTFGEIDYDIRLKGIEAEALQPLIETIPGETYDADLVDDAVDEITDYLGTLGFAFVDVRPQPNQDREGRTVGITYFVGEGPKVFVERIDIEGNVRTLDRVIRREFQLAEGDAFNTSKMRRSNRRIRNLGFFKSVDVTNREGSQPDRTVITATVEEQSTGEISFGIGFSTVDSVIGDIGIRERNLLGRGQDLRLKFSGSTNRQQFDVGFTEPYFMDRDVSAGFDLFRILRDETDDSSFKEESTGARLRAGYDLAEDLRHSVNYLIKTTEIKDVEDDASRFVRDQEGSETVSQIGHVLTYDTRDSRSDPTEGYFASIGNDLAGLGGTVAHLRTNVRGAYYVPIYEDYVLGLIGEGGYIFGLDDDVGIAERYFVGGNNFRGFARNGIGPRDSDSGDALGGNTYYVGTAEVGFPLGLPGDLGIKGFVFTDVGSLYGIDDSGSEIVDSSKLRASVGTGLAWATAFGLIRIDVAQAVLKEDVDDTEIFRFSFGTRF